MDYVGVGEQTVGELEAELTTLAGHLNAGNYRFLMLLAEFDARQGYAEGGSASCAEWLSWRCGIGLVAARDKVRVARALRGLPVVSDAMRRGVLSYCKVRAISRVATAETEAGWVKIAEERTVSHVEQMVQVQRRRERSEELEGGNARHAGRYLQAFVAEDGCVCVKGLLSPEQGALFMQALRAAGDAIRESARDSRESSGPDLAEDEHGARAADALEFMAEAFLAGGSAPLAAGDRHVVHIHVDERILRDPEAEGRSEIENHAAIPPATVKRLCCDGALIAVVEDANGKPLQIGRKTRVVPTAVRRALDVRDGGCRFPGCSNTRFVDAHHIHHWIKGGETRLENLVLLCRRHHRYLHEYGYQVDHDLQFTRPDGCPVIDAPPRNWSDAETDLSHLIDAHAELDIHPATSA